MALLTSRRSFLKMGARAAAGGGLLSALGSFQRALAAADTSGYRALVCVYLDGGNDSFNMIAPIAGAERDTYAAARGALAVPAEQLLPLSALPGAAGYGLHPACAALHALSEQGRVGVVANVGALLEPVTREQYRARAVQLPAHLFSHADQQRVCMGALAETQGHGWAGRTADLLLMQGHRQPLPVNLSVSGLNAWQAAADSMPYVLSANGAARFAPLVDASLGVSGRSARFLGLLEQAGADDNVLVRALAGAQSRAVDNSEYIAAALEAASAPATTFPNTGIGRQLAMAARIIAARQQLGASRQLIFVRIPGWDMHDHQLQNHPLRLAELCAALKAFSDATVELGIDHAVTAFTTSEFGRTLTHNGDGTDHGWGAHHLVVGGAVRAGLHGRMPLLTIGGPDDAGAGRIIPGTAFDQYFATLARWLGLGEAELDSLFPQLSRFASRDLGFMS